ncbi:conserved hypothetical protein [Talaromyces stipitatus ATCC 10500]|uniref:Transcription initiation factor TFIID subunit 4 n=1 Tax=Talaromyces stipitatus (strain ATCC 10500 / CBS 375.48 / QM 6759 / NRRL 1006) TaxID=441959 RepID=B8M3H7_TALSN|nr:uncharacterized protein TSTA_095980 [Talaromyces stipitatus ATCC 10500]EED22349.1 conserved hypothetical protein [Talaromyces stipitatus ATCC 10500]
MAQAQPQQPPTQRSPQYPPNQPFSPPVSTPTPPVNAAIYSPPPKRPRLSPLPQSQSTYASPSLGASQLPQAHPTGLNNGFQVNGMSTPGLASVAPAPPGSMGPPSRPADKPTDASDLTDVLAQSGIDVREEEAYLTQSYAAPVVAPRPQAPGLNTSFTSAPSTPGIASANVSFDSKPPPTQEQQIVPAYSEDAPYNQPTYEETQAARRSQYHLQEPFLLTKVLEQKMQKRAYDLGVRLPTDGLYHPMPGSRQPIEVTGPDGSSIVRRGHTIINQEGAPLVDILSLMSLCCEERLRGVIEYSASLSKSRRLHSHGAIPAEWQALAATTPKASGPIAGTPSKRPHAAIDNGPQSLVSKYLALSTEDMSAEQARAAKRAKRNADNIISEANGSRAPSIDVGSGAATPLSQVAMGLDKKGITKKEAKKQLDARATEAQQHQQSVETARKALSSTLFGGSKKRTYSWLNKGSAVNTVSSPRPHSPALGGPGVSASGGNDTSERKRNASIAPTEISRLGDWREDKSNGIQVRDILFMLEQDGRGSRHVQKAYSKDLQEERIA